MMETEGRRRVSGAGVGGNVQLVFGGDRASAGGDEKVLKVDGGDGHITV